MTYTLMHRGEVTVRRLGDCGTCRWANVLLLTPNCAILSAIARSDSKDVGSVFTLSPVTPMLCSERVEAAWAPPGSAVSNQAPHRTPPTPPLFGVNTSFDSLPPCSLPDTLILRPNRLTYLRL